MSELISLCVKEPTAIDNRLNLVTLHNPRHITLESGVCDG